MFLPRPSPLTSITEPGTNNLSCGVRLRSALPPSLFPCSPDYLLSSTCLLNFNLAGFAPSLTRRQRQQQPLLQTKPVSLSLSLSLSWRQAASNSPRFLFVFNLAGPLCSSSVSPLSLACPTPSAEARAELAYSPLFQAGPTLLAPPSLESGGPRKEEEGERDRTSNGDREFDGGGGGEGRRRRESDRGRRAANRSGAPTDTADWLRSNENRFSLCLRTKGGKQRWPSEIGLREEREEREGAGPSFPLCRRHRFSRSFNLLFFESGSLDESLYRSNRSSRKGRVAQPY